MTTGQVAPARLPTGDVAAAARARRGGLLERAVERRWPLTLVTGAALVGIWQAAGALGWLPPYVLTPGEIAVAIGDLIRDGDLWSQSMESLRRAGTGFGLAVVVGGALGLAVGVSRVAEDLIDPPLALTYGVPKIAVFPALAVIFGFSDRTRIIVIFLVCVYPVYFNAQSGTRAINPDFIWLARNCGAGWTRTFLQVVVPAALPRLLVGVRIGLALSFVMLFATEIVGYGTGLGSLIYLSYQGGRYEPMYAGIVILGCLGFACDVLVARLSRLLIAGQDLVSDR